ncbi:hypothetical protein GALL_404990 [mine drainage metagenome]|uniref:Uncharacterized protein n=1 Tax=mine drainage metagenome TaxID=410659 RepID=A0A1J5Q3B1_9ZZZZ
MEGGARLRQARLRGVVARVDHDAVQRLVGLQPGGVHVVQPLRVGDVVVDIVVEALRDRAHAEQADRNRKREQHEHQTGRQRHPGTDFQILDQHGHEMGRSRTAATLAGDEDLQE